MNAENSLSLYEAALATQQWETVAPLIHPQACVTFSNGSVHIGKDRIQQAYERNFALIRDERYSISDVHWISKTPSYAVCLYRFEWQGLIAGEPAGGAGRGTSVLVREAGEWLLLAEHLGPAA